MSGTLLLFDMEDGQYYTLNEVGKRIWELCDGTRSLSDIAEDLSSEYDSPSACRSGCDWSTATSFIEPQWGAGTTVKARVPLQLAS